MTNKNEAKVKQTENAQQKGKVIVMKDINSKTKRHMLFMATLMTMFIVAGTFKSTIKASVTIKCYTISTSNTTVYSNTGLTKKYGRFFIQMK